MKKIKFVKLANHWFVHLPEYQGAPDDLLMVSGANIILESIDCDKKGILTFVVWEPDVETPHLTLIESDENGATYESDAFVQYVWLCNVTKHIFGKFPEKICYKKIYE